MPAVRLSYVAPTQVEKEPELIKVSHKQVPG
jgi:hypothetical protein